MASCFLVFKSLFPGNTDNRCNMPYEIQVSHLILKIAVVKENKNSVSRSIYF